MHFATVWFLWNFTYCFIGNVVNIVEFYHFVCKQLKCSTSTSIRWFTTRLLNNCLPSNFLLSCLARLIAASKPCSINLCRTRRALCQMLCLFQYLSIHFHVHLYLLSVKFGHEDVYKLQLFLCTLTFLNCFVALSRTMYFLRMVFFSVHLFSGEYTIFYTTNKAC